MKNLITFLTFVCFISCNNFSRSISNKIFYFDFITNDDSLNAILVQKTYRKIIYMDTVANTFRVVPASYSDEQVNQLKIFHISEAPKYLQDNVYKIEIKVYNNMNKNSVSYSVKKFIYFNKKWNLKSELGNIKIPFTGYRFSTNNRFRNDIATNLISSMFNDIYFSF